MISATDLKKIYCTSTNEETCEIIELAYQEFKIAGDKVCLNINKYQP